MSLGVCLHGGSLVCVGERLELCVSPGVHRWAVGVSYVHGVRL